MAAYYSVKKVGDTVVIRARDRDAKQVLFGWAGSGIGDAELYGRGTRRGVGDNEVWEWKLSSAGVGSLFRGINAQVADPKRWGTSDREWKALNELRAKFAKLRITGGGSRMHTYGGKSRHAGSGRLERSYLRPFAVYCGGCHKYLSGKEHVWHVKGTEQYLCNACGGGTGGGKKRHALSKDERLLAGMRRLGVAWKKGRALPTYKARMTPAQKLKADKLYDKMSESFIDQMASDVRKLLK